MRIESFGISFDVISMDDVVALISEWINSPEFLCRYIVTPNVDHIVNLSERPDFRGAYAKAALSVVDGWPVSLALQAIHKVAVPIVPGSDLVPGILGHRDIRERPTRVFLLGAAPGVADFAAQNIRRLWPGAVVVGTLSPAFGFEKDPQLCRSVCELVSAAEPDLLVIGLGAPKQELWVAKYQSQLRVKVAICAGATIDFLSGRTQRAPVWIRRSRLEWAFRMAKEPRRLAGRYLKGALHFPILFAKAALFRRDIAERGG